MAGKLAALVCIECLRLSLLQGTIQRMNAEVCIQCVRQLPADHLTAVPVNDGNQIHKPLTHRTVRDVSTPHLIEPDNINTSQKVWILIQRRCERFRIDFRSRSAKDLRNPLEQLSLPLANLNHCDFMLAGQLVYGSIPLVGFQCYLSLELGLVSFSFCCHDFLLKGHVTARKLNLATCPVYGVHYTFSPWFSNGCLCNDVRQR